MTNFVELNDLKITQDIILEYDKDKLQKDQAVIVIDNGSYMCRAGWSTNDKPLLEFRSLIAKPRKDRKKDQSEAVNNPPIQIGNDITNIEAVRLLLKSQFDRNIVVHFQNQEQIFDYIFNHLGMSEESSIEHNIIMTEALGNPIYCRQQMNELLFECYEVPGVSWCVDSLLSWWHNQSELNSKDALIISFGYHTTHVIPVLDNQVQFDKIRRLNIGGYHMITFLHRIMQMKYPQHINAITLSRMELLMHEHSEIVVDYMDHLKNWADSDFYIENVKKIQLPYSVNALQSASQKEEQKLERRKEMSRRLIESNARRAKEKLIEDQEQIHIMANIRSLYENGDMDEFRAALKQNKLRNLQELDKLITMVHNRIEKAKLKALNAAEPQALPKEPTPKKTVKPPDDMPVEEWISEVKEKRSEILKQKNARKSRKQELARRHTAAAQERMRIISQLARNEKGSDEFGMNDKDWDVYKAINRDNDSESEAENEKLTEYNTILQQYDPSFDEMNTSLECPAEMYQLHVGVEMIRTPEILFQPSMVGSCEAGLDELIDYVIKLFNKEQQQRLADNVFLTGGCAEFKGLKERLSKELLQRRPFQTTHNIRIAKGVSLDAWRGGAAFANSNDFLNSLSSKKDYEENGSDYFKEHSLSNLYYPIQK